MNPHKPQRRMAMNFDTPTHSQPIGAPNDPRGLFVMMRRYLEHRGVLGSSEIGLGAMEYKLRQFVAWADARGITHPSQVSRQVLQRYQRWLYQRRKDDGEPLSVATRRTLFVPLRGWFRWLTREGWIAANPAADVELPRTVHIIPRNVLSAEEAEVVLTQPDVGTTVGLRDRALLEVLYATGMRRMELARLCVGDIDAERCTVLVRQGKGGRDRLLPLGERALYWLQQYLQHSRPLLAHSASETGLFLGQDGVPMYPSWVSERVMSYVKRADLGKQGGCHLLRHTMATLMLEGGADIRFIQAMLGHAHLTSTQIYTHVAVRQLQKVHAQTHPGARLVRAGDQAGDPTQHDSQKP